MCKSVAGGFKMNDEIIIKFGSILSRVHTDELDDAGQLSLFNAVSSILESNKSFATKDYVNTKIENNNSIRNKTIIYLSSLMVAFVTIVISIFTFNKS